MNTSATSQISSEERSDAILLEGVMDRLSEQVQLRMGRDGVDRETATREAANEIWNSFSVLLYTNAAKDTLWDKLDEEVRAVSTNEPATIDDEAMVSLEVELHQEADFEGCMPREGSIQQWAEWTHKSIRIAPYEINVRHRLECWLINQVAKHHPKGKVGAIRWFNLLSLRYQDDAPLMPWANEAYRIIVAEKLCTPEEQNRALALLKIDLGARGVTNQQYAAWLTSKQMPQRPERPAMSPRRPLPNPPREQKPRTLSKPYQAKSAVVANTRDDYKPSEEEITDRIILLQDQLREAGALGKDEKPDAEQHAKLFEAARLQLIAEHRNVA